MKSFGQELTPEEAKVHFENHRSNAASTALSCGHFGFDRSYDDLHEFFSNPDNKISSLSQVNSLLQITAQLSEWIKEGDAKME